jgi:hypothetical protein
VLFSICDNGQVRSFFFALIPGYVVIRFLPFLQGYSASSYDLDFFTLQTWTQKLSLFNNKNFGPNGG